ncbi:HAD-IIB family hydrolase [Sphingopyxis chilensis]
MQKIVSSSADKRLIIFDLDGTLAASKQAIDAETARLLAELLAVRLVAVISGGDWAQFERQLLGHLPAETKFANLFLLPTTGTKLYRFDGVWRTIYAENFTADERKRILDALENAMAAAGLAQEPSWGAKIENRGSQITFSGLGQSAPLEAKLRWDPDIEKRHRLKRLLDAWLPDFEVHIGGSTSIDITRLGIDKAYGIGKLASATGVDPNEMLFIGDALYPGGNDAPVRDMGVTTIAVSDIGETRSVIATLVQNA